MAAEKQVNLDKSLLRYLYENIGIAPENVPIFETIYLTDYGDATRWVVIDNLGGMLGPQPSQLVVLHMAVANVNSAAMEELGKLQDLIIPLFEEGTRWDVWDYPNEVVVGEVEVCNPSLSPVLKHSNGGLKRSLTIEVLYVGN